MADTAQSPSEAKSISTELSARQTGMSFQRTRLSADRTLMSVIRTSLSLIGFGFTIFQVFEKLHEAGVLKRSDAPKHFGEALATLGIGMLVLGIAYHVAFMRGLRRLRNELRREALIHGEGQFPVSMTLLVALSLLAIGLFAVSSMACDVGPFGPASASGAPRAEDPLPSWNGGATRSAIVNFVTAVTTAGSEDFVPAPERIATFDNDGTLWSEQPMYVQLLFVFDRIRAMAADHPEWKTTEPYKSVLAGDLKKVAASGEKGIAELLDVTHAGVTIEAFEAIVRSWMATARHPTSNRPYTEMVYQPMLEVLTYLRAHGFKTFIVSGGGTEFMRPWVEQAYGIPPEQVIGSRGKLKYEVRDGTPVLLKLAASELVDDGPGKPVGIGQMIGRKPIAAFGNSDGDLQMLEYAASGPGRRFMLIVHHTDAEREWAYDRGSHVGRLELGLAEAARRGWLLADMKRDWKVIHPGPGAGTWRKP